MNGQRHQCTDDTVGGRTFLALSFREKKAASKNRNVQCHTKNLILHSWLKKRKKAALPFF